MTFAFTLEFFSINRFGIRKMESAQNHRSQVLAQINEEEKKSSGLFGGKAKKKRLSTLHGLLRATDVTIQNFKKRRKSRAKALAQQERLHAQAAERQRAEQATIERQKLSEQEQRKKAKDAKKLLDKEKKEQAKIDKAQKKKNKNEKKIAKLNQARAASGTNTTSTTTSTTTTTTTTNNIDPRLIEHAESSTNLISTSTTARKKITRTKPMMVSSTGTRKKRKTNFTPHPPEDSPEDPPEDPPEEEHFDYHVVDDAEEVIETDHQMELEKDKLINRREKWIQEESVRLTDRMEKKRCDDLMIRQTSEELWQSRLNVVVGGSTRHDWLLSEKSGCASLFRANKPRTQEAVHEYAAVAAHAELIAEKCKFMLAREEWTSAANIPKELRLAQMETVEGVWSAFVREKQALVNANLEDVGWLQDIQAPHKEEDEDVISIGLFGISKKKRNKKNPKRDIFRRWKLLVQKEMSLRMNDSIFGKKKLFLEHCMKIYRLVLLGLLRDAFNRLYKERPAPFSFKLSKIVPGSQKQKYDDWGDPILSRQSDIVLCLDDGSIVLNLSKQIVKRVDRCLLDM